LDWYYWNCWKGPNYRESYNSNKTIGDVIETLNNKKIVVLKHKPRYLDKYEDINNPYWSNETTLR
jgi:hypothetical protein